MFLDKEIFMSRLKSLVIIRGWTRNVPAQRIDAIYGEYGLGSLMEEDLYYALTLVKNQDNFDERQLVSLMKDHANSRYSDSNKEQWAKFYRERRLEQSRERQKCTGDKKCQSCPRKYCHIIGKEGMVLISVFAKAGTMEMSSRLRNRRKADYDIHEYIKEFYNKFPQLREEEWQ